MPSACCDRPPERPLQERTDARQSRLDWPTRQLRSQRNSFHSGPYRACSPETLKQKGRARPMLWDRRTLSAIRGVWLAPTPSLSLAGDGRPWQHRPTIGITRSSGEDSVASLVMLFTSQLASKRNSKEHHMEKSGRSGPTKARAVSTHCRRELRALRAKRSLEPPMSATYGQSP